MKKLTPTSVILMIAGTGVVLFLYFYFKEKKAKTTTNDIPPASMTNTAQGLRLASFSQVKPPVRLVKTPTGFMTR